MLCVNTDAGEEKHLCGERKWADIIQKMCLERRAAQLDTILIAQQHCRGKGLGLGKKIVHYMHCLKWAGLTRCPKQLQFGF